MIPGLLRAERLRITRPSNLGRQVRILEKPIAKCIFEILRALIDEKSSLATVISSISDRSLA
jgi:hypothetical protein